MAFEPGLQRRVRVLQEDTQTWQGTFQEFQVFAFLSQLTVSPPSYFLNEFRMKSGEMTYAQLFIAFCKEFKHSSTDDFLNILSHTYT